MSYKQSFTIFFLIISFLFINVIIFPGSIIYNQYNDSYQSITDKINKPEILYHIYYLKCPNISLDYQLINSSDGLTEYTHTNLNILPVDQIDTENPDLLWIKEMALSEHLYDNILSLQKMEQVLNDQTLFEGESELLSILKHLSIISNIQDSLLIRKKAIWLLGLLGKKTSRKDIAKVSKNILISILKNENNINIQSETIYALGMIGINEEGETVKVMTDIVQKQNYQKPDNYFALSVIVALEMIVNTNKEIQEMDVYILLIEILERNYEDLIKERASDLLVKLSEPPVLSYNMD